LAQTEKVKQFDSLMKWSSKIRLLTTMEALLKIVKQLDALLFQPETVYKYSKYNFVLQKIISERITKI